MKTLTIMVALTLVACGVKEEEVVVVQVEVESVDLQTYVNEFLEECDVRGVDCNTNYAKIDVIAFATEDSMSAKSGSTNTVGLCVKNNNGSREVYVADKFQNDTLMIKYFMFHELGHCVLDLEHVEGKIAIMNSFTKGSVIRANVAHWWEWVDDLFNSKN